jgi:hypothetical protein
MRCHRPEKEFFFKAFQIRGLIMPVIEQALSVLVDFMTEMCDWENKFLEEKMMLVDEGKSTSDCNTKYTNRLRKIFELYTIGDSKTLARLSLPGASSPVMYDPTRDYIHEAEAKGKKVFIKVDQVDGFKSSFRFTLVDDGKVCKIIKKDTLRNGGWEKSSL